MTSKPPASSNAAPTPPTGAPAKSSPPDKEPSSWRLLDDRLQTAEAYLLTPLDPKARESFRAQVRVLATHIDALDPPDSPCDIADAVDAELPVPRRTARSARSR